MEDVDTSKVFLKWRKIRLWKSSLKQKKQFIIFHNRNILETTDDKLPRNGSISPIICPVGQPEIQEAIENTKTLFKDTINPL